MRYFLVRHVETYGNLERRLNGHTESEYTPRGVEMKKMLEEELKKLHNQYKFHKIYASPISRAKKIGETLSKEIGLPLSVEEDLKEFNFGIFEGLNADEAMEKYPVAWEAWMADYNKVQIPEGECYLDYHARQKEFLEKHAIENQEQNVVIIAHGGTVHSLLLQLLDLPLDSKWHFQVALGGIVIINVVEKFGMLEKFYTPNYEEIQVNS